MESIACLNCLPIENHHRAHRLRSSWDVDREEKVARCWNCGYERPFYPRTFKQGEMTVAQKRVVEVVHKQVFENDSYGFPQNYEYKKFEVTVLDWGAVEVLTEVGWIGDEGTMGEILGRVRRHIFIGPRGGLTLCNPARFVQGNGGTRKVFMKGKVRGRKVMSHPTM